MGHTILSCQNIGISYMKIPSIFIGILIGFSCVWNVWNFNWLFVCLEPTYGTLTFHRLPQHKILGFSSEIHRFAQCIHTPSIYLDAIFTKWQVHTEFPIPLCRSSCSDFRLGGSRQDLNVPCVPLKWTCNSPLQSLRYPYPSSCWNWNGFYHITTY